MSAWPLLKTPVEKAGEIRWWHHALACLAVLFVPTILGFGFLNIFAPSAPLGEVAWETFDGAQISMFALFATFSFYFSWIGLLFGVPAMIFVLRRGIAGWGTALLAGLIVGALIAALLSMSIALPMGPFLALIYWLSLRLLVSEAFSS